VLYLNHKQQHRKSDISCIQAFQTGFHSPTHGYSLGWQSESHQDCWSSPCSSPTCWPALGDQSSVEIGENFWNSIWIYHNYRLWYNQYRHLKHTLSISQTRRYTCLEKHSYDTGTCLSLCTKVEVMDRNHMKLSILCTQ